jgi:hypothetical protein
MVSAMQPLAVVTAGAGVRCPGFPGDPPVFPVACCSALFGVDRPRPLRIFFRHGNQFLARCEGEALPEKGTYARVLLVRGQEP